MQRKTTAGFHFVGDADSTGFVADWLSCGKFIFQGQNNAARATTTTQSQSRSLPVCLIGSTKAIISPNIQTNQGKLGHYQNLGSGAV
jgi:hypothetical protein